MFMTLTRIGAQAVVTRDELDRPAGSRADCPSTVRLRALFRIKGETV